MFQTLLMVQCVTLKNEQENRTLTHCLIDGFELIKPSFRDLKTLIYSEKQKRLESVIRMDIMLIFIFKFYILIFIYPSLKCWSAPRQLLELKYFCLKYENN